MPPSKPYTFSAGTPAVASEVNADFDALYAYAAAILGSDIQNGTIADTKLASPNNGTYRHLARVSAILHDGQSAFTGGFSGGGFFGSGVNQAATGMDVALLYLAAADFAVAGKTTKLRVRAQALCNDNGFGQTATIGLYPVTSDFGSGPDTIKLTLGTVVSGSTVAFSSLSADSENQGNSGDFTIPADGYYVLGCVLSAAVTSDCRVLLSAQLQQRVT